MVINFFRSQQPLAYIMLAITAIVIWIAGYGSNFAVHTDNAMPFYFFILSIIKPFPTALYFLSALTLIIIQAIHLNNIINKHEVLYKSSLLPGLFFILLSCAIPQFISFHPLIIVNSILIFILDKIFRLYKNETPLALDFDICVLLSVATLFYFPAIIFILIYAIGLIILRPFSWRDWIVGLMGFLTPVFFVILYFFLTERLNEFGEMVFRNEITRQFNIKNAIPPGYPFTVVLVSIVSLLSILKLRGSFYKNVAKTRNYQQIILFFLVVSLLFLIFTPSAALYRFSILAIPLSVVIAYYFLAAKKMWISESLFYIFIILIIYNYLSIN